MTERRASKRTVAAKSGGTTLVQARVDTEFARVLIEEDAPVLGLRGVSELVREALRLLHRHAREQAAAAEHDAFYRAGEAPLPAGVAPAEPD